MTSPVDTLKALAERAIPFLRDEADKYEDDGSNEPLELIRDIEDAIAALSGGEAEPDGYALFGTFHLATDADDRIKRAGIPLYTTPRAVGDGWRPIESAPKDCSKALMFGYPFGFRSIWIGRPHGFDSTDATHWQPLPAAPSEGSADHFVGADKKGASTGQMPEDTARLDFIERTFSGMTNRERYLPVQMIWGKGANGRTLREACDKYMKREVATPPASSQGDSP